MVNTDYVVSTSYKGARENKFLVCTASIVRDGLSARKSGRGMAIGKAANRGRVGVPGSKGMNLTKIF